MGHRKLPSELIFNEKACRIAYEKRKKGMMKKAREFDTPCDVDMCMIICGRAGSAAAAKPKVWPVSPKKAECIIERYMCKGGDRRAKRMAGLPEFFVNQKGKVDKAQLANWEV